MRTRMTIAIAFTAIAFAQGPAGPGPAGALQPNLDDIKAYLTLTDSQIQAFQQLRQQERQALETIRTEMAAKRKALHDQLEAGSTDAAALGRLLIEIEPLRKRIEEVRTSFHNQAVNTLSADQKAKLKTLEDTAKLRDETRQAAMLQLLAPPERGAGEGPGRRGFHGPGGPGPGGFGGPGGPGPRGFGR